MATPLFFTAFRVCEAVGCSHPDNLDLTYRQLLDWNSYIKFRDGVYSDEDVGPSAKEQVDKMKNIDSFLRD